MSDARGALDSAIGLLEFDSIVAGIVAGDAMVKSSPVSSLYAGTVHPGRYLVLVAGDTAMVEIALEAGTVSGPVDSLFLADVHPAVITAIAAGGDTGVVDGDALGIVETSTSAAAITAADAGVKGAAVTLGVLRLADGLGGKAYCLFTGSVSNVEAAVHQASARAETHQTLLGATVIAQLHPEMAEGLAADLRFNHRLRGAVGGS